MRILSLGAGVQSTALLYLILNGRVQCDRAIFADTGSEPAAVYAHLGRLRDLFPIDVVSTGNLGEKVTSGGFVDIPLYQTNANGGKGQGRRQCTYQFKMRPIRRRIRELGKGPTDLLMGISLDEIGRMRDSGVAYIRNVYPLVDMGWTRWDCTRYLTLVGVVAPRSACVFCPYRTNAEWRVLAPAEFEEACRVDDAIRGQGERLGFLHADRVPLREVDFSTLEDHGQTNWLNECEGMCGV
jgi:hypothetical protein